ncbi:thiamine pyrophosphate-binding protein [Streptomyces hoynatensis]|uniref:Thiamine pyrophosphate-binding protein n=1 Tax=Streptomyces hoynatensis TaxID=1141874 RepID=A0A3A9YMP9_9ACTN|nr:thiamine pyrophosphate-binding protein [Streptomyces hoynatensis]RKN36694.1 thiamine pyrophosphate-binding protein [Streptomyces hoynatensis]
MFARPGKAALFEQFAADGITHMFGNPGTVEQGFLDLVDRSPIDYVLTLHEGVAVGMADGFARATRGPALVQLHSGVGLGNGIGMLYQAKRGHSPLVVLVGEAGVRYDAMDGQMAADLVAMAEPVTKWAARVLDPSSVLRMLRRAVKIAMTPPRGPVVLVVPADVLDQVTAEPAVATSVPSTRVAPAAEDVAEAARLLAAGERPLILMGDGVAASGAQRELAEVAEWLGAPVWGVDSSEVNLDATHPLYRGQLGHMFGSASARVVGDADAVLIVGTYVFPEVFPALRSPFREGARLVHLDLDAYEIAKNFPVSLGMVADPKLGLAALKAELERRLPKAGRAVLPAAPAAASAAAADGVLERFTRRLADRAPEDLAVFDEALTASGPLLRNLPPRRPGHYFQTRGGSLGVGIPGALGMKLARPEQPVVGFTGDGGSMYTFQALWTAARYGIAAGFVVCNNQRYRLLDDNIEQYWRELGTRPHAHPDAFDLSRPDIDFTGLARALGIRGVRVDKPEDVEEAVDAVLEQDRPVLVDLRIS